MFDPDPIGLAERQLARDATATARYPGLFERKRARMAASPLAYLRGAAPLFYELLADYPALRDGPAGTGWLCGDAHLENFGVYRTEKRDGAPHDAQDPAVFDVNDFDEATIGPLRYDVLRLITSLILGGRELGAGGQRTLSLSGRLFDAYSRAAFGKDEPQPLPAPVRRLQDKVEGRSHRDLLAERTELVHGKRRFVRGDRYAELPEDVARAAVDALGDYGKRLEPKCSPDHLEVMDVAFRIAGTGSLGGLRVAALTRGKGDPDGAWIFDMKEESAPSSAGLIPPPAQKPAERVLAAVHACLEKRPRMTGVTTLGDLSMFVRRLTPQEDKLNLTRIKPEDLEPLAGYLGALLGRAHRRGIVQAPQSPWTAADGKAIVDRAIVVAGIHEASYLALCRAI